MDKHCGYCGGDKQVFNSVKSDMVDCEWCGGTGAKPQNEQIEDLHDKVAELKARIEALEANE